SSSASSLPLSFSSSSDISRHFVAFMIASERPCAGHELGLDAELLGGETEAVLRRPLVHTLHLVEDPAGLHHRHPELGIPLALAHPRLRGLLGHRLFPGESGEDLCSPPPPATPRSRCAPASRGRPRSGDWSPTPAPAPSTRSPRRTGSTRGGPCPSCARAGPSGT